MFSAKNPARDQCEWDPETTLAAAMGGHLAFVQWMFSAKNPARAQCEWSPYTACVATNYGHVEFARWAREHGCPE
jgi:hypothetical protein